MDVVLALGCTVLVCLLAVQDSEQTKMRMKNFFHSHGHRLNVTALKTVVYDRELSCTKDCLVNPICHSFNTKLRSSDQKVVCELLNITRYNRPDKLVQDDAYVHWYLEDPCKRNPCKRNPCPSSHCEHDYTRPTGFLCRPFNSCKEAFSLGKKQDGAYDIETSASAGHVKTYCHMTSLSGCAGGGWTLTMKVDGSKETFEYDSSYWTNEETYNIEAGKTGFDNDETKLPWFASVPFEQVCLGMKVGDVTKFLTITYTASSLHSVFVDNTHHATNVDKSDWLGLIPSGALEDNCDLQGFNVFDSATMNSISRRARLGIVSNNENDCDTPDSYIGVGGYVYRSAEVVCQQAIPAYPDVNVAGNGAFCLPAKLPNPSPRHIKAMAYIFVR